MRVAAVRLPTRYLAPAVAEFLIVLENAAKRRLDLWTAGDRTGAAAPAGLAGPAAWAKTDADPVATDGAFGEADAPLMRRTGADWKATGQTG